MKPLPLGIETFSKIIEEGYLYIDKTKEISQLFGTGQYFFLSRPRRFGKSLLISALDAIFRGRKELFKGLYIYDKIEWKEYPVIRLDLSTCKNNTPENLEISLNETLDKIAKQNSIELTSKFASGKFLDLIQKLSVKGKVAILIDEYDKPLIDHLTNLEIAKANREILKDFYGMIKASDEFVKFAFITGVSKFSQVSIFSGLNNIRDISLLPEFSSLLGYTQEELENYFADRIEMQMKESGVEKKEILEKLRLWCNGYSWDGKVRVYNPFSILNYFQSKEFRNYWFESGTPTFLMNYIKEYKVEVPNIERAELSSQILSSYNIENIQFESLLLQTGYLTIVNAENMNSGILYTLDYPNEEVRLSFLTHIVSSFLNSKIHVGELDPILWQMQRALSQDNLDLFFKKLRALFASIPYTLHLPYEAYYHSLFYMVLKLIGCKIDLEVLSSKGRVDGILELEDKVYIIELKLERAEKAIEQIKDRKYADAYMNLGKRIILLGIGYLERELSYIKEEV